MQIVPGDTFCTIYFYSNIEECFNLSFGITSIKVLKNNTNTLAYKWLNVNIPPSISRKILLNAACKSTTSKTTYIPETPIHNSSSLVNKR